MTVEELISKLQKVEDKNSQVFVAYIEAEVDGIVDADGEVWLQVDTNGCDTRYGECD